MRRVAIGAAIVLLALASPGAAKEDISYDALMVAGPLRDMVQGHPDAPVVLIEYGNFTCSHCVEFHRKAFPALKARYVDTGKVRFIFREIVWPSAPDHHLDAAAFMLARCVDQGRYIAVLEELYRKVDVWLYGAPVPGLRAIASQFGLAEPAFKACFDDGKLQSDLAWQGERIQQFNGVGEIPAFFIVDRRGRGAALVMRDWEQQVKLELWDKLLESYLGK